VTELPRAKMDARGNTRGMPEKMGDAMPSPDNSRLPWWAAPLGFRWFAPTLLIGLFVGTVGVAGAKYAQRPTRATELLLFVVGPIGLIGAVLLCIGWKALLKNSGAAASKPR
jgi:hypothetical protein